MPVNPAPFMAKNFPEMPPYIRRASRMYEHQEAPHYRDNWWFNFDVSNLQETDFMIFIGAKDYADKEFKVFKVPSRYILANLDKVDQTPNGWINLYLHLKTHVDVRNDARLPFGQFAEN